MKNLINTITSLVIALFVTMPVMTAHAADISESILYDDNTYQALEQNTILGPAVMYINGTTIYTDGSGRYMLDESGRHIPVWTAGGHYFFTECNGDVVCIDDKSLTMTGFTFESMNGIPVGSDKNGRTYAYIKGELRAAEKFDDGRLVFFDKDHNIVFAYPNGDFYILGAIVDILDMNWTTEFEKNSGINVSASTSSGASMSLEDSVDVNGNNSISVDDLSHMLLVYTDWNGNLYYNDDGVDRPLAEYEGSGVATPIDLLPTTKGYIVSK